MTSSGRSAKKPHCRFRSSTRPSAKHGDSAAIKSRINCPFMVSFGRNGKTLLTIFHCSKSWRRQVLTAPAREHKSPRMANNGSQQLAFLFVATSRAATDSLSSFHLAQSPHRWREPNRGKVDLDSRCFASCERFGGAPRGIL